MTELILNYRLELVIAIFVVIAAIWLWQSMRFTSSRHRSQERADTNNQLSYDYLVWKLDGNVELADELIRIEREKNGSSLKQAIDQVNKEIAKDTEKN
ncbi:hypothetical protein [Oxalicibacterium faecigallinarum]|nr:hypothetical protein [Oxalicibacterium faecigallinarum]